MKLKGISLIVILLMCSVSFADDKKDSKEKDRERVYGVSFDKVWSACIQAATKHFTIRLIDKENGILTFESGRSLTSQGLNMTATVSKINDESTKVFLTVQTRKNDGLWGGRNKNNMAKKYFAALDGLLKNP